MRRRHFLGTFALASASAACRGGSSSVPDLARRDSTPADRRADFRSGFALNPDHVHMSALFVASHPREVREAIDRFRAEIDADPVLALQQNNRPRQQAARDAAARYLGVEAGDIALTDSTTMGLGLIYNGLRFRPGDEVLTTEGNYYVTHEAVRQASARYGATTRQIPFGEEVRLLSADALVERLSREIVSFDIAGLPPDDAARRLRERGVIATVTPYAVRHVRLTPSIVNTPSEADRALAAIRDLA